MISRDTDYQRILEASPAPYLILELDLTIVAVTDAYLAATNTVREQILGRNLFEVFPDNPSDPYANGVSKLRSSLNHVLQHAEQHRMSIQKYDIPLPEGQGKGFELRYWSPLNTPVFDALGELSYIIHWVEDVTRIVTLQETSDRQQQAHQRATNALDGILDQPHQR